MKKCIKQFYTGYNTNKEGKTMTEKQREQQQVYMNLREMLEKHGFNPENTDRTNYVKWYKLGTISGLEDYIPEPIDTTCRNTEIMDPTYLVYRVNIAEETTEYAFVNYGENVNNVAFIKDAQDPVTFDTVMQLIMKNRLFAKLPLSFSDVLETVASYADFDLMRVTQDWSGIMLGDDFYQVDVEKGQCVVRFTGGEDEPDSYFFVTDSEAQKILGCANSVEALDAVSSFLDWEVQI